MDDELAKILPTGWYILYCPYRGCHTTLMWTSEVFQSYGFDEWFEALDWAVSETDHEVHTTAEEKK